MKHRIGIYIIMVVACLLMLAGCTGKGGTNHVPQASDSLYTEEEAKAIYDYEPERAMVIIDSAEMVGNITDYRADLLRAIVYSKSSGYLHQDSAVMLCEGLLQNDKVNRDTTYLHDIYDILIISHRMRQDYAQWMRWVTKKADLCRAENDATEALRTEADLGYILYSLGRTDEGLSRLDSIIGLLNANGSVARFDASIIALRRKIDVLRATDRYADIIPVALSIVERLDHYEQHPQDYAQDSYRLSSDPDERAGYCDFYRAKAYVVLAEAYANTAAAQKAREYLSKVEGTRYADSRDAHQTMAPVYMALGDYSKALALYDDLEEHMGTDTLTADYANILYARAEAANATGHHAQAYNYLNRYATLNQALTDSTLSGKAHEYAARYHAQEQQLEIEHQHAALIRMKIYIGVGLLLIVLSIGFAVYYRHQKSILRRKNEVLVREISENMRMKRAKDERVAPAGDTATPVNLGPRPHDELFTHICDVIRRERLYLNPAFDRQAAIVHFHLTKEQIGGAFSRGSEFNSIADFIRDCRLEHATHLLETTDLLIGEVASASGFTHATTFNHDFKARFSVSPSAYRAEAARNARN